MTNPLHLIPGQKYVVIRSFKDYDDRVHHVNETWIFQGTDFLPYEDGLSVNMEENGLLKSFRLQWREEAQAAIIEHFKEYVSPA